MLWQALLSLLVSFLHFLGFGVMTEHVDTLSDQTLMSNHSKRQFAQKKQTIYIYPKKRYAYYNYHITIITINISLIFPKKKIKNGARRDV